MSAAFDVRADIFRAVQIACSSPADEAHRSYLEGVFIEPHPVEGVVLVATDGHRMMVAHDATGSCSEPVTVKLNAEALRHAKCKRSDGPYPRRIIAKDETSVSVMSIAAQPEIECAWRIDAAFPDWRRVLPKHATKQVIACFNPRYLADFAKAADELMIHQPMVSLSVASDAGPALVSFNHEDVFGVLMPVAAKGFDGTSLPYFMSPDYRKDGSAA